MTTARSTITRARSQKPETKLCNALKQEVSRQLVHTELYEAMSILKDALAPETDIFIVGGFVRDCARRLCHAERPMSKDLDVVARTRSLGSTINKLPGNIARTPLGGVRWQPESITDLWIDVWQLCDTVWIDALDLETTISSYLAGVDLNIARAAVSFPSRGAILGRGFYSGIVAREIRLDAEVSVGSLRQYELVRAVVAHVTTGFCLGEDVKHLLEEGDGRIMSAGVCARLRGDGHAIQVVEEVKHILQSYA